MPNLTLASGQLTASGDRLIIELHQPTDLPPTILFRWPAAPSIATPKEVDRVIAAAMSILAQARVQLSRMKAQQL